MREIYNVPEFIRSFEKGNFGWDYCVSEFGWYLRYLHAAYPEMKRNEAKEKLKEMGEKFLPNWNYLIHYKFVNGIMKRYWRKEYFPFVVKEVKISQGVVDWFVAQDLKKNELKLLFAMYMRYIFKHITCPEYKRTLFDYGQDKKFFRHCGEINKSKDIFQLVCNLDDGELRDKYFHYWLGQLHLEFIDEPELEVKMTREDISELEIDFSFECGDCSNGNYYIFTTDDFYHFGEKFWEITKGKKLCKRCHCVIDNVKNKKYCDECAKIVKNHTQGTKLIKCVDCGKEFEVSAKNNKTTRCPDCQKARRREQDRERKFRSANRKKNEQVDA